MNRLHVGFSNRIELPPGGFLYIDDDPPRIPFARVFNPLEHSLNPLSGIDYKRARDLADVLYTTTPQGENTLRVRDGRRDLLVAFLKSERIDKIKGTEEVTDMISDLLMSPILKRVLCNPTNFSFNQRSVILARINRAELGDFDALVLGLILIGHYKGQIIVPDFGFYGRDTHTSLVREERLIAGINFLDELPLKLRRAVLLIKEKHPSTALLQDARLLASYAGIPEGTNGFNSFVNDAIT